MLDQLTYSVVVPGGDDVEGAVQLVRPLGLSHTERCLTLPLLNLNNLQRFGTMLCFKNCISPRFTLHQEKFKIRCLKR